MELNALVERVFQNSIAAKIDCVESITPALVRAGQLIAISLLADRKVLAGGDGAGAADAPWLVSALLHQGERERPGLPAILLAPGHPFAGADYTDRDTLSRQVSALGQPGDVLVLYTHDGTQASLLHAIQSAHERGMAVIAFTAREGGNVPALLDNGDVEVRVPLSSRFRIHEMFLLLSFALCELAEWQLFGGE